jgi:preprotein translocase subunit SecA
MILLQTIDHKWKEHLQSIDRLKEGINLRAYAQKDPVIEYKKEAFTAFESMNAMIMVETIEKLLKIQVASPELAAEEFSEERARDFNESEFSYEGPEEEAIGSFGSPTAGAGLPFARPDGGRGGQPPRGQEMFLSRGGDSNDYPKLNRAQRREAEKKNKKKLKF